MATDKKTTKKAEPTTKTEPAVPWIPPVWWKPDLLDKTSENPFGTMLLQHAYTKAQTVLNGHCVGILEDEEEEDEEGEVERRPHANFLKLLCDRVKATTIYATTPIFGRGATETWLIWSEGAMIVHVGLDEKVQIRLWTMNPQHYKDLTIMIGDHILPENVRQPV